MDTHMRNLQPTIDLFLNIFRDSDPWHMNMYSVCNHQPRFLQHLCHYQRLMEGTGCHGNINSNWKIYMQCMRNPWAGGSKSWPQRWRSNSPIMNTVLAANMIHILCEYGECSLNCIGVIMLTRRYDLEGQGHALEDEGQGHPYWTGFLPVPCCIFSANMVNVAWIIPELSH